MTVNEVSFRPLAGFYKVQFLSAASRTGSASLQRFAAQNADMPPNRWGTGHQMPDSPAIMRRGAKLLNLQGTRTHLV